MNRLVVVSTAEDIFPDYKNSPVGLLLEYHNLNRPLDEYAKAELLIGMCMDNRKHLRIPDNFFYHSRRWSESTIQRIQGVLCHSSWRSEIHRAHRAYQLRNGELDVQEGPVHTRLGGERRLGKGMGRGAFHAFCAHIRNRK